MISHVQPERKLTGPGEYRHILIPTNLSARDRAALTLGMQLAAASRAKVTLLHVLEASDPPSSVHWLDAIDQLNRAMSESGRGTYTLRGADAIPPARLRAMQYLEDEAPAPLRTAVEVEVECRVGDPAEEIVRFAQEESVDLTILCCEPAVWGLPILPALVRRVMQAIPNRVVLVRPDAVRAAV